MDSNHEAPTTSANSAHTKTLFGQTDGVPTCQLQVTDDAHTQGGTMSKNTDSFTTPQVPITNVHGTDAYRTEMPTKQDHDLPPSYAAKSSLPLTDAPSATTVASSPSNTGTTWTWLRQQETGGSSFYKNCCWRPTLWYEECDCEKHARWAQMSFGEAMVDIVVRAVGTAVANAIARAVVDAGCAVLGSVWEGLREGWNNSEGRQRERVEMEEGTLNRLFEKDGDAGEIDNQIETKTIVEEADAEYEFI